eukprot:scaffold64257_cov74-Cyclotella_meneghiniana.AAC.2
MESVCKHYARVKTIDIACAASKLIKNHPTLDDWCLTDKDLTCSIVTLLKLGIAVGLKPAGDVLIFNPQEPHALSSRVYKVDELVCLSWMT